VRAVLLSHLAIGWATVAGAAVPGIGGGPGQWQLTVADLTSAVETERPTGVYDLARTIDPLRTSCM
jgi:hypothetical protein